MIIVPDIPPFDEHNGLLSRDQLNDDVDGMKLLRKPVSMLQVFGVVDVFLLFSMFCFFLEITDKVRKRHKTGVPPQPQRLVPSVLKIPALH